MTFLPKVVLVCPPQIKLDWGFADSPIKNNFDENGNLVIRSSPSLYTQVREGTPASFVDGFTGSYINRTPIRIGFSLKVMVGYDEEYLAIEDLIRHSISGSGICITPITVYDYYRVDTRAEYQAGYATRVGLLSISDIGGSSRTGTINCNNGGIPIETPTGGGKHAGFTLKFQAKQKTLI